MWYAVVQTFLQFSVMCCHILLKSVPKVNDNFAFINPFKEKVFESIFTTRFHRILTFFFANSHLIELALFN